MNRILGQDDAIAVLQAALRTGRMHHAWIFSGPAGVGKHTTAVALATVLLDREAGPDLAGMYASDPDSRAARLVAAGSHPDLHLISKELAVYSDNPELRRKKQSNIPIDLLRERMLGGKSGEVNHEAAAYRTAVEGHRKVFIIDEAELLDGTGQNAMLKTLEEPPPDTFIILVTSQPERLLPTIRSRCQHVRFRRLDDAAMGAWFDRAELEVTPEVRSWIESFADGSPGTARLAVEHDLHAWQQELEPMLTDLDRGVCPVPLGATLAGLVERYATTIVKAAPLASKDAANKAGARHLLHLLSARERARLAATCARGDDPAPALAAIGLLRDTERHLYANVNMKQEWESLVAGLWRG